MNDIAGRTGFNRSVRDLARTRKFETIVLGTRYYTERVPIAQESLEKMIFFLVLLEK